MPRIETMLFSSGSEKCQEKKISISGFSKKPQIINILLAGRNHIGWQSWVWKLCSLNLLSTVTVFGRNSLEGGASWASRFFLVVDEMRAVIFNFPSLLCQHSRCVFHLERMLIWDTGALGFPEHCLEC